jgi:protein associated with RNAse G/E
VDACWDSIDLCTSRLVPGREHLPRNERKLVTMETCQWLYTSVVAETAGLSSVDDQHWSRISLGWSRDRTFLGWYVNFQRPLLRTEIGYDSMDLVVDLVVEPDSRTWRWKDQADFERAIKRHIIEDELRESVQEEADRVLEMASRAAGPFASEWAKWRPPPKWGVPKLRGDSVAGLQCPDGSGRAEGLL